VTLQKPHVGVDMSDFTKVGARGIACPLQLRSEEGTT